MFVILKDLPLVPRKNLTIEEERIKAMVEDVLESQSMAELKELWCFPWENRQPYAECPQVVCAIQQILPELRTGPRIEPEVEKVKEVEVEPVRKIPTREPIIRGGKKYRLVKTDTTWAGDIEQVHAIMKILTAHLNVGDVVEEEEIVKMMVSNEGVLNTTQGGRKVWNYYKGRHNRGLQEHGNIERA